MLRFNVMLLMALLVLGAPAVAGAATAPLREIEGSWTGERVDPGAAGAVAATLSFTRKGNILAGTMQSSGQELALFDVRDARGRLSFTLVIPGTPYVTVHYAGTRTSTELKLASADEGNGVFTLSATRPAAPPRPAAASRPAPPAPAREASSPALRPQIQPPPSAQVSGPGVPDYISRLLGQPAVGGGTQVPEPPAPPPTPRPATRTASLPPTPALRPTATPPRAPLPAPTLRPSQTATPPRAEAAYSIEGSWIAEQTAPGAPAPVQTSLTFRRADGVLSGTMRQGTDELPLFEVRQAGDAVSFMLVIPGTPYLSVRYMGTIMADNIELAGLDDGAGIYKLTARLAVARDPVVVPPPLAEEKPLAPEPRPQVALLDPPALATEQAQEAPASASTLEAAPPPAPQVQTQIASLQPPPPPVMRPVEPAASPPSIVEPVPEVPTSIALAEPAPPPAAEPMPEIASIAPPPARAPAAPVAKLPLPSLHDVAPLSNVMKTPPMGWASRQRLGTMISDEVILEAADGLDETGLKAAGYTYVEVDDGWQGARDANGELHGNEKFPDMKALGGYIHAKGFTFGLMTSAAPQSCAGFTGSYGHEVQDAKTFAEWGVDILIYDWCGAEKIYPTQAEMQAVYQKMGDALRTSGRNIAFAVSEGGGFNAASWASKTGANLWRSGKDVEDTWQSVMDAGAAVNGTEAMAGPGRWNDPGLVQVGNDGMTPTEYRAHLNLWAVLGAPIVLGTDVRIMRRETVDLLTNKEVLAIDQDAAGLQGRRIVQTGNTEVWAKPLADGSIAVAFINRGNTSAPAAVSWQQLGIEGRRRVRDVWWHETIGIANNRYAVFLTAHTSLLLRLSPP